MGDRSYFQLLILDAPISEHKKNKLREILDTDDITREYGDHDDGTIVGRWINEECYIDTYETIGRRLIDEIGGLTFEAWNDPKYEYAGGYVAYASDLG